MTCIFNYSFLLVNFKVGKFVLSRNTQQSKSLVSGTHHLDTLRTFYHYAVETFLLNAENVTKDEEISETKAISAKETYWCSEYHKCHALKDNEHILCVLYTSTVPTHTMRLITSKTSKILVSDKQVCW